MTTIKIVDPNAPGGGTGSDANPYTLTEMRTTINGGSAGAFANFEFWLNDGIYPYSATGTLSNGGTASGQCVIKARNRRQAVLRAATGAATVRIQAFQLTTASNANYLTWDGLVFDGNFANGGTGNLGIQTSVNANLHHLTVKNCTFIGLQGDGLSLASIDYLTAEHNIFYQNGLRQPGSDVPNSTSSCISLNAKSAPYAFDSYQGFHNKIAYNVCAAQYGRLTDGNGIILDNGGTASDFTLQNTLIIRNIVYGCGGRGIHNLRCAAPQGHWIVNNLCFKNCLDKTNTFTTNGWGSEFDTQLGGPTYFYNNIAVPWTGTTPYGSTAFRDSDGSQTSNYHVSNNKRVTGGKSSTPLAGGAGLIDDISDPGLVAALTYNPDTIGDAFLVPDPRTIGTSLSILSTSALRNSATDPRLAAAMTSQMVTDIGPYLTADFGGRLAPTT